RSGGSRQLHQTTAAADRAAAMSIPLHAHFIMISHRRFDAVSLHADPRLPNRSGPGAPKGRDVIARGAAPGGRCSPTPGSPERAQLAPPYLALSGLRRETAPFPLPRPLAWAVPSRPFGAPRPGVHSGTHSWSTSR